MSRPLNHKWFQVVFFFFTFFFLFLILPPPLNIGVLFQGLSVLRYSTAFLEFFCFIAWLCGSGLLGSRNSSNNSSFKISVLHFLSFFGKREIRNITVTVKNNTHLHNSCFADKGENICAQVDQFYQFVKRATSMWKLTLRYA